MSTKSSTPTSTQNKNSAQFVGFRLNNQGYAFPIGQIQEIVILQQITRIPQVSEYVEGVSNLRGTIIPIINLRRLMGMEVKENDDETRTIVVNVNAKIMGCMVDSVTQVIRIPAENIQPAPRLITGDATPWIAGFAKLEEQLLIVLNIDELLNPEKLEQVKRAVETSGLKMSEFTGTK